MPEDESEKLELFPECSGDPLNCPENEGHGCCDLINRQIAQKNRQHEALKLENAELLLKCVLLEEELATLRAKVNAYDEGFDAWAVFQGEEIQATSKTKDTSIAMSKKIAGYRNPHFDMWPTMELRGYTCRKVRVCKEVAG